MQFYQKHNIEAQENLKRWESKPVLRKIYQRFYELIAQYLRRDVAGLIVELGSGIGNLKLVIPDCVSTEVFSASWIDQVENAYKLSFSNQSVSNLILFDVWHHLEFPGSALEEFYRVLTPRGRVIIFDPAMSFLGFIIYGLFHKESIGFFKKIKWLAPDNFYPKNINYYAAQGNASRIFCSNKFDKPLINWTKVTIKRISSISYIASGGYSGRQFYPDALLSLMFFIDRLCDYLPWLFATRLLVVLEKK